MSPTLQKGRLLDPELQKAASALEALNSKPYKPCPLSPKRSKCHKQYPGPKVVADWSLLGPVPGFFWSPSLKDLLAAPHVKGFWGWGDRVIVAPKWDLAPLAIQKAMKPSTLSNDTAAPPERTTKEREELHFKPQTLSSSRQI